VFTSTKNSPFKVAVMESKLALVAVAVFSGFVNILMLTGSIYMMQVYDRVLSSRSLPTLYGLTVLVLMLFVFMGVFDSVRARIMARIGERLDMKISPLVFNVTTTLPLYTGAKQDASLPVRDFDTIKSFLSGTALMTLFDLPWLPFYLFICFLFHPWVGGITLIGLSILVILTVLTDIFTKNPIKYLNLMQSERLNTLENARRQSEVLRAMGMTPRVRDEWLKTNEESLKASRLASDRGLLFANISKIFRMFLQSAVLAVGAILVIKGEATGGVMIACSILTARAMAPVEATIAHWRSFTAARQAHQRLASLLNAMPIQNNQTILPAPKQSLRVKSLAVVPPGGKAPVLQDITFQLQAGQGLALLGPSASGKSSLSKALIGVWQAARGEVRLDGALLSQWNSDELGASIGYLPQDVSLFKGTVGENIARFYKDASTEEVISAAKAAYVHELIVSLPQGYDTPLGENGMGLSQGQSQRVALARALFGNPFLIVLDEPNANLDSDGEQALTQAIIEQRKRGAIVIVVAHRPSAIEGLSHIAILQKGRLTKFGTKEQMVTPQPRMESGSLAPALETQNFKEKDIQA
jgi:PrtD family type I secretion system ABC transporter